MAWDVILIYKYIVVVCLSVNYVDTLPLQHKDTNDTGVTQLLTTLSNVNSEFVDTTISYSGSI